MRVATQTRATQTRAAHIHSPQPIPVDFFADPDGRWNYDDLARAAGFELADVDAGQLSIGALTESYAGFPEGAAVVMFSSADGCSITLVDCTSETSVAA